MIKTNSLNNKSILENLYRILRMSLLLGDTENRDETISNFDDTARKIDKLDTEAYNNAIQEYTYTTVTLEEEEKKLEGVIQCLDERITSRRKLEDEYREVLGHDIEGLDPIEDEGHLPHYEQRLKNIQDYLDNTHKIESTKKELVELSSRLEEEKKHKVDYESSNEEMEETLRQAFSQIAKKVDSEYYNDINITTINDDLEELEKVIKENQQSLNIFTKSYETLRNSGISSQQEVEYAKYVREAKEIYYTNREQEYMLKLYQLILDIAVSFDTLYEKRRQINQLLEDRLNLRKQLNINTDDVLLPLYNLLDKQFAEVTTQKANVDKIASIVEKINFKTTKLENLTSDNQRPEILDLLKEFCFIDEDNDQAPNEIVEEVETVQLPDLPEEVSEDISEDVPEYLPKEPTEELPLEELKPNTIIKVSDLPDTINLDIIKAKTNTIMKRVGEMLGIKDKVVKTQAVKPTQEPISNINLEPDSSIPNIPNPQPELPQEQVTPIQTQVQVNDNSNNIEDFFWPESTNNDNMNQEASYQAMPNLPQNK